MSYDLQRDEPCHYLGHYQLAIMFQSACRDRADLLNDTLEIFLAREEAAPQLAVFG